MSKARVLVVMPVFNEARHLRAVLHSLAEQNFDRARIYVVAVDGGSTDGSVSMLNEWFAASGIAGCLVANPRRKIPISLNAGLRYAGADDIVVRLDAHSVYGRSYLTEIVAALEAAAPDVGCVGGAHVPNAGATFTQKIVEALYTNPMGLGGADYRFGDDVREVDNVYLGAWRPGLLVRAGGFNEELEANEDGEMSARIRALGYRILRVPLPCRFIINRGLWGSIRQWHRYGYWRCKMLARNPRFIRRRHVLSPAAALLAIGLAVSPIRVLLLPLFGLYALGIVKGRKRGEAPLVTLATIGFFPVLHFAYAAGIFTGLLTARRGRDRFAAARAASAE